jgi:hypothetical protein
MQTRSKNQLKNMIAQECARIMIEHDIKKYYTAKVKAASNLNLAHLGCLPSNSEIEEKLIDYYKLFHGESHEILIRKLRKTAFNIMNILAFFEPLLVGPVASGTASSNSHINIHLTAENMEDVIILLESKNIAFKLIDKKLKMNNFDTKIFNGLCFIHEDTNIDLTIFSHTEKKHAPISRINNKPMVRVKLSALKKLIQL